jgi:hypothetical protein
MKEYVSPPCPVTTRIAEKLPKKIEVVLRDGAPSDMRGCARGIFRRRFAYDGAPPPMFPTSIRFLLATASAAFGVYQIHRGSIAGGLYVVAGALLIYGHFRYGPVWLALRTARRGNMDRTRRLLAQVHNPRWLTSDQRAYFELTSALVAADRKDDHAAEKHLRLALDHRLRTENDRALLEVMLARILIERGTANEADEILARAAARGSRPEVARMIDELKRARGSTLG